MKDDKYYQMVAVFYEGKFAKRSGVPYLNHIDEGMILADELGYSLAVKQAFCLHPIFQADEALAWSHKQEFIHDIDPYIMCLVMEYRKTANSYLSPHTKTVDQINLSPILEVNQMLILDKVQNRKDFDLYHLGTHERSAELDQYFRNWLAKLSVNEEEYQRLKQLILQPNMPS